MSEKLDTRPLDEHPNLPQQAPPISFMLRLANALHNYGMTAYELEGTMEKVGDSLGYEVECLSQPTNIIMSFSDTDEPKPTTFVFRVEPGDIHLEKQLQVNEVVTAVTQNALSPSLGSEKLEQINNAPSRYGSLEIVLGFGLVSAGVARVLDGSLNESLVALAIGLMIGLLDVKLLTMDAGKQLFPTFAAALAAIVSSILAHFGYIQSPYVTTLAGVIVLVPGLLLTTAIAELSSQHSVSGTARLFAAGTIFMQIGFGMAIGNTLGARFFPFDTVTDLPNQLPLWTSYLAIVVAGLGLFFLFQARPKDVLWVLAAGVVAYTTTRLGTEWAGPIIGALIGAFCMSVTANIFERITKITRSVMLMPGIILLVPGSIGFQSLTLFVEHDVVAGLDTAFKMSFIGIALVTGLLMASIVVPPRTLE